MMSENFLVGMFEILLLLSFISFVIVTGIIEAILWSGKSYKAFKSNEHTLMVVQRVMLIQIIICIYFISKYVSESEFILLLFSLILIFNLFHNGAYYETRRMIDVPSYRWYSNSTTSSAKIEIKFIYRLIMAIVGLFIFIGLLFY